MSYVRLISIRRKPMATKTASPTRGPQRPAAKPKRDRIPLPWLRCAAAVTREFL